MDINPFIYGRALDPSEMVGRQAAMGFVLGRLAKRQSTAVIGPPHSGKTTFLQALAHRPTRQAIAGTRFEGHIFSIVDAQTMQGVQNQATFWQRALQPLAALLLPASNTTTSQIGSREMQLLALLKETFSASELQTLCLAIAVNYEDLSGTNRADKARELVLWCGRNGRLETLVTQGQQMRPHAQWPTAPQLDAPAQETLASVYATAVNNQFGNFVLEQLFRKLHETGRRFVLLIDEFDDFLANKALHTAEFYGGLRSLASRSPGLALIIATRRELEALNQLTQEMNPHGSPYFNVFTEYHLGSLSKKELTFLLQLANGNFDQNDVQFVVALSGGHPFLAQTAAGCLWEAHALKHQSAKRYQVAGLAFFQQTYGHFAETWRGISPGGRRAATAVALQQLPHLATNTIPQTTRDLSPYESSLEKLVHTGLAIHDESSGWSIRQQGFLWWLVEDLRRTVRSQKSFSTWLHQQALDSLFTPAERNWMSKAAAAAVKLDYTYKRPKF